MAIVTEIIEKLRAFLNENQQAETQSQEDELNVVESEPSWVVQNTGMVMNTEQGIPNDVIAWLLAKKKQPVHPSISSYRIAFRVAK